MVVGRLYLVNPHIGLVACRYFRRTFCAHRDGFFATVSYLVHVKLRSRRTASFVSIMASRGALLALRLDLEQYKIKSQTSEESEQFKNF